MCIMASMLRVTVINTLSPEKHFIYKTDLTARFVCNAEHSSQTPTWPCEPWLLLWCQLFHRDLWNGSDEWGPVRLHSLGGLESIQLSVTLPALTVTNTMQAADNTPIHYKKKKRDRWKEVCLPPFNASLIYATFRGPAWGGDDEVCLYNYVEQDIHHPSAPSTKAEHQTAQMLPFLFLLFL